MPLDNNDTERLIRDMVMGKKAYLFCRDLDACKRAAMMYSLFGACKVLDKKSECFLLLLFFLVGVGTIKPYFRNTII